MRSERLLREVVRRVLVETVKSIGNDGVPVYMVTGDDIPAFFSYTDAPVTKNGVSVYVPFSLRKQFADDGTQGAMSLANLTRFVDITPKNAAELLKKGYVTAEAGYVYDIVKPENLNKKGKLRSDLPKQWLPHDIYLARLRCHEKVRDKAIGEMAGMITGHFGGKKIQAVMAVDSSYGMSFDLAEEVANRLGVPFIGSLKKNMDSKKVDYEYADFSDWETNGSAHKGWLAKKAKMEKQGKPYTDTEQDYRDKMFQGLEDVDRNSILGTIANNEKPSLKRNIYASRYKFWNLFAEPEQATDLKRVLVVDDNLESGLTGVSAKKRLKDAGYDPLFAAGYLR